MSPSAQAAVGLPVLAAQDLAARSLPVRLAAVLAGVGLVALGSALYIGAGLGSGPRDSLMLALSAWTRLPVGLIRGLLEGTVLGVGWLLGGVVGVGTVLFALGIGPAVQLAFRVLRIDVFLPSQRLAGSEAAGLRLGGPAGGQQHRRRDQQGRGQAGDQADRDGGPGTGTPHARTSHLFASEHRRQVEPLKPLSRCDVRPVRPRLKRAASLLLAQLGLTTYELSR